MQMHAHWCAYRQTHKNMQMHNHRDTDTHTHTHMCMCHVCKHTSQAKAHSQLKEIILVSEIKRNFIKQKDQIMLIKKGNNNALGYA